MRFVDVIMSPHKTGEIEGKKVIREAEGSSRTIGNHCHFGVWHNGTLLLTSWLCMCFGKRFPKHRGLGLVWWQKTYQFWGRTEREKLVFTAGMYNYNLLILRREESISVVPNTMNGIPHSWLYTGVALWHHFFPSCHLSDWNSSIFIHAGFCCYSHCCINPAKDTLGEVPRHPELQVSVFSLLLVLQVLLRALPGWALLGSKQAAGPKTGGEQLLPRATFLSDIISTLHWNSCNLWPEIFQKLSGELQAFWDAQRGAASILGCSGRLETLLEAQRGCKHFGMLSSKGSFSERGCTQVLLRLGCFCWTPNHFRQWSHWVFFLLVHLKECLGELQGGSFSKFTFMKYE